MGKGPYRAGDGQQSELASEHGGIVDDLVRQFADPLAFYRELVQNAIDAETEEVVVTVQHAPGEPMVVSVTDRGEGMDQEVLQEKLLVLFRSGKEERDDKIGKFGVGFVSVLALEPERVTVRTSKGKGKSHVLHLKQDHSYELFETGGGSRSGTTVSLTVPIDAAAIPDFVQRSVQALTRWCRFAQTPIQFREVKQGAVVSETRIDRPIGFEGADVQVTHVEGGTRVVAALADAQGAYAGFFNQGLLLHETRSPFGGVLDAVRFIVQDGRLEHTLSRDDVRRDDHFRRALRLAERVVRKQLVPAASAKLAELAESSQSHHARVLARVVASMPTLPVDPRDLVLRRITPVDGRHGVTVREAGKRIVVSARAGALADLLVREGWVVVPGTVRGALERAAVGFTDAMEFKRLAAVETRPADEALMSALADVLEAAARRPSAIALVEVEGASTPYPVGPPPTPERLHRGGFDGDPFRLLRRPGLLLDVAHPIVVDARAMAEIDPQVAAGLLARDVLLHFESLDADADTELTQSALVDVLGVEA